MSKFITSDRILDFILYMQKQSLSTNTVSSYAINIKKLKLFLNNNEISREQMLSYKQWLIEQGFKKHTINAYLAAANYFCGMMGWEDMKVALISITPYNMDYEKQQISSYDYEKLVYTALQNNKERLAMMLQVLCHMDLRFCELCRLTVGTLETGYVEVIRKNRKIKIKIPDIICENLKKYTDKKGIVSGIIFCTKNGNVINRSNFSKELKRLCILADIDEEAGSIQHIKNVVLDSYPYFRLIN